MNDNGLSRRGILGAFGAAALLKIAPKIGLPFKPKAEDIVIATEMPSAETVNIPAASMPDAPSVAYGDMLYDKHGRPVAVITDLSITRELIDVTSYSSDGYRSMMPGLFRGSGSIDLLMPFKIRYQGMTTVVSNRHDCVVREG